MALPLLCNLGRVFFTFLCLSFLIYKIRTIPIFIKVCVLQSHGGGGFSPKFSYSLEELTGLRIQFYSLLSFITGKTFITKHNQQRENVHGQNLEGSRHRLPGGLSRGAVWGTLVSLSKELRQHRRRCCLSGKLSRDSALRNFTGGQSYRHLLPSIYHNSRLLEGRHLRGLIASVGRPEGPKWQEEINYKWQTFFFPFSFLF